MKASYNKAYLHSSGGSIGIGFWTVFALMMGFGLPIFIHTKQGNWKYAYGQSAEMAFFFLGLGLVLWLTLIIVFSNNFLFSLIRDRSRLRQLHQSGKRISAQVVEKRFQNHSKNGEFITMELTFKNIAQAIVNYSISLYDSKPEERRFEVGKKVTLLVEEHDKNPVITLESGKVAFNKPILRLILLVEIVLIFMPIGLLSYGYQFESQGQGWRYLTFWHPFIMCAVLGLIYMAVLLFFRRLIMAPSNNQKLLLYGKSAEAIIQNATETGLSINDRPQIMVHVSFEHQGKTVFASFKKIYSLLEISTLVPGSKIMVIYDFENPQYIEPND